MLNHARVTHHQPTGPSLRIIPGVGVDEHATSAAGKRAPVEEVDPRPGDGPAELGGDEAEGERTVLVIDDHQTFAELLAASLAAAPGIRCLGTATSAAAGLELTLRLKPSLVVMDIEMPGVDGLTATRQLRSISPATAVAVVSAHSDGAWIARAARAGASAFIPKGGSLPELLDLLRRAEPGKMILPPSLANLRRAATPHHEQQTMGLTPRELEALELISQGLADKNIATVMGISIHTCRGYIKTVYGALQVNRRIDAVNEARRHHLID